MKNWQTFSKLGSSSTFEERANWKCTDSACEIDDQVLRRKCLIEELKEETLK